MNVVGISIPEAGGAVEEFLAEHGVTFTVLEDLGALAVTTHYDIRYWSQFWLLDRAGNRIGDQPTIYSTRTAERILTEQQNPKTWNLDYLATRP